MDGKNLVDKDTGSVDSTRNIQKAVALVDIYENEEEDLVIELILWHSLVGLWLPRFEN